MLGRDGGSFVPPAFLPACHCEGKIEEVLAARAKHRESPVELAERCKVPARTVSRIIARAALPRWWELDPISGERTRAGRATGHRYERDTAGELLHIDVKKPGKIPKGAGSTAAARRLEAANGATSTLPWMIIPAWPTSRSSRTRRNRPAPGSWPTPQR